MLRGIRNWSCQLLFATGLLSLSFPALAQDAQFEVTPLANFLFAASFEVDDIDFGRVDVDLDETADLGLAIDIPINRHLQIELLYLDQSADADLDTGFLSPSFSLGEVNIETYHAGVLWQGASGQLKPFFVITAGISNVDLDIPGVDSESAFSLTVGGGIKAFFSEHIGLRLDGRLFVISIDDSSNNFRDCCYDDGESFGGGLVSAGLILAF